VQPYHIEVIDSHPYLLLAIEHHYASTRDYEKRAVRRELYTESWVIRRELGYMKRAGLYKESWLIDCL
jgi:hypothetical protein